ncbi:diguanylate cyclase [Psychromonas sp. MME2]|uniref:diguanylate cyclase n=1 Tax=Psychromonas sp. MME2 TaxID=3231033 RepID=UPI00339CBB23
MTQTPNKYILVVEDSQMFTRMLTRKIESVDQFEVIAVASFNELKLLLAENRHTFFASLLDVNLPDAPNGEVIDYVLDHNIPSIVFTGKLDQLFRDNIYKKGVVDYILKEGPANVEYVISLLKQLLRNQTKTILIVDDSRSVRGYIKHLLSIYQFNVLEAEDGVEALHILKDNPSISLVLTDFNMPNMDGVELTKHIRQLYSSQDLAIIGMSTYGNNKLSAHFLKIGGSDFINKPFLEEEFFCRINQNMELLEHISELQYLARCDYLTGLYNRRYFFEQSKEYIKQKKDGKRAAVAILDIDFFKKINDTYGHDAGDLVLKKLGVILRNEFADGDVVARYGGEEFCFLLPEHSPEQALQRFENLRKQIEDQAFILSDGHSLKVTSSIGVYIGRINTVEDALNVADKGLYRAKENGRNQVVLGQ